MVYGQVYEMEPIPDIATVVKNLRSRRKRATNILLKAHNNTMTPNSALPYLQINALLSRSSEKLLAVDEN